MVLNSIRLSSWLIASFFSYIPFEQDTWRGRNGFEAEFYPFIDSELPKPNRET